MNLKVTAVDLLLLLVIPLIIVLGLTFINRDSKQRLVNRYGGRTIVWLGGLGVIIHELSHLVVAVLFGHRIDDFRLLIPHGDGALGYVSHSWIRGSSYQFLGNALIGTAPIYGCTAALILLTRWLVPSIYWWGLQKLGIAVSYPVAGDALHWLPLLLWALLSINITIGGFDLSNADLKNAFPAVATLYIIIGLVLMLFVVLGRAVLVQHCLAVLVAAFGTVMVISLCWSLLVNILVRLLV